MNDFVKNKFQNNVKIYTDNLERIVEKVGGNGLVAS